MLDKCFFTGTLKGLKSLRRCRLISFWWLLIMKVMNRHIYLGHTTVYFRETSYARSFIRGITNRFYTACNTAAFGNSTNCVNHGGCILQHASALLASIGILIKKSSKIISLCWHFVLLSHRACNWWLDLKNLWTCWTHQKHWTKASFLQSTRENSSLLQREIAKKVSFCEIGRKYRKFRLKKTSGSLHVYNASSQTTWSVCSHPAITFSKNFLPLVE